MDGQLDRGVNKQADGWADRQRDKRTDRQMEI